MTKRDRKSLRPTLKEEEDCRKQGYRLIAGVDEVGRGCLAGPVVASAVIMPRRCNTAGASEVRDSKLLTAERREALSVYIHKTAISIGTGVVYPDYIDRWGMTAAVQLAMKLAVEKLSPRPDFLLLDYLTLPDCHIPQKGVEDGDTLCFSIACASIVAKVYRDCLMLEFDRMFPGYGLARNKGYGTEEHLACLRRLGPSAIHRRLFQPVKNWRQLSFEDLEKAFYG